VEKYVDNRITQQDKKFTKLNNFLQTHNDMAFHNQDNLSNFITQRYNILDDKKLNTYETWFFKSKEKTKELQNKWNERSEKHQRLSESRSKLKTQIGNWQKSTLRDLDDYINQCNDRRKEYHSKIDKRKVIYIQRLKKVNKHKGEIKEFMNDFRANILYNEYNSLSKTSRIFFNQEKYRENLIDKSIKESVKIKKEYDNFQRKLNLLRDFSIKRLNDQQKKQIYINLKKEEKEKKKKEEEDKLKELGLI